MTDNVAVLAGYTVELLGDAAEGISLHLLVKPDTDLDDHFQAWCCDEQEFLMVSGWMFTFKVVEPPTAN